MWYLAPYVCDLAKETVFVRIQRGWNARCLATITDREISQEHRRPTFDLIAKLRARSLKLAGQILRLEPKDSNSVATGTHTYLGTAPWLDNGPGPYSDPSKSTPDQRNTEHYGFTVLVRRVDGQSLQGLQPYEPDNPGDFGW